MAVKLEFGSLIDALNNGQVDIVCAGMSVTPERAAAAAFSDSYVDDDIVMICRADSAYAGATTFDELADASILGQAATMYDDVIAQIAGVMWLAPSSSARSSTRSTTARSTSCALACPSRPNARLPRRFPIRMSTMTSS